MRIVLQDMERNIIKEINDLEKYEIFANSPKVKSIEYYDDFKIFDKLNQDLIILKYCKNSKDFLVEYISQNHVDLVNAIHAHEQDIVLDYNNFIGRYFSKIFPFISGNNLLKLFSDVALSEESFEFREVKYIDDILISIHRHKLFYLDGRLFHLSYPEEDLDLLYFAGEEFFDNSERPYILIEGNEILKVNAKFLDYFNVKESEILGEYDFERLGLIGISRDDLDAILNNLLNRKSFFETFEFSVTDSKGKIRWIQAFASPSSHNYNPAVKIFFKDISAEKEYELEANLLRDTLDLVQNDTGIAGFYKRGPKEKAASTANQHSELLFEGILNDEGNKSSDKRGSNRISEEDNQSVDFNEGIDDGDEILNRLDEHTVFSKGIFNILDLSIDEFCTVSHDDSKRTDLGIESDDSDDSLDTFKVISDDSIDTFKVISDDSYADGAFNVLSDDFYADGAFNVLSDDSYGDLKLNGDDSRDGDFKDDGNDSQNSLNPFGGLNDLNKIEFSKYISVLDKEDFKRELKNFSKNYDTINTNFRIISETNQEKYLNFIMEGQFKENGENSDYIGFLKDKTLKIQSENILKDNLAKMDFLLGSITSINQELEKTQRMEEKILHDSHILIKDLLYLFIRIMDYSLSLGMDKRCILENFQRRINVLLLIHQYIDKDFDLLNISIKDYVEESLRYLSQEQSLKLDYKLDLEDLYINIGSLSYLGIILYEFAYNMLDEADEKIAIKLEKREDIAFLRFERENGSFNKGKFDIGWIEDLFESLDFKFHESINEDSYEISIPIVNERIVSLNS